MSQSANQPMSFHLGRSYDLTERAPSSEPVHYEARDLTTHGVIVGMTGSGKTGLSINLLEEAALDDIPCIMIDPKGDLTNLLLQFPDLRPSDFQAWLPPEEAERKGLSHERHAEELARRWRDGLAETGQDPAKIRALKERSAYRIYTPGSEAGLPLSILQNFAAPQGDIAREDLNQKIDATVSALLGLTGVSADPIQSREHIVLAKLLQEAWNRGEDLELADLIEQLQEPPEHLERIGALPLNKFFKPKERDKLAIALNNILAAPSFSTWLEGEPLDLSRLLKPEGGRTKQLIFYIAHLDDNQRMFFVTLLLAEVLSWTRKQKGTSNLRALLYFDEVFGYLPPHPGNPPSKQPLMTLLKQARAFGVGVLLATQNPVDLDYKALSNAGTWFVGKLQTERDKARLLDGLDGAAEEHGSASNRSELEKTISALGNRVFLLHNIHRSSKPMLFQTRWALSYLRGPMSREEIAELMEPIKRGEPDPEIEIEKVEEVPQPEPEPLPEPVRMDGLSPAMVATPPDMTTFYLPVLAPQPQDAQLVYRVRLLAFAEVGCKDKKMGREYSKSHRLLHRPEEEQPDWSEAEEYPHEPAEGPEPGALWEQIPKSFTAERMKAWEQSFLEHVKAHPPVMLTNPALKFNNQPGEDRKAFSDRLQRFLWEDLQKDLAKDRETYASEFARYHAEVPKEPTLPEEVSFEERWKTFDADGTVLRAEPTQPLDEQQQKELRHLEEDWHRERVSLAQRWRAKGQQINETPLKPKKGEVTLHRFGLAWAPFWRITLADGSHTEEKAYRGGGST